MTEAQQQALNDLTDWFNEEGAIFTVKNVGDKLHVAHKKPRGHWFGHITIMPNGERRFGKPWPQ